MIRSLVFLLIDILWVALLAQVILSWLIVAGVRNDIVIRLYRSVTQLLDPIMRPLRRVIPTIGMVDITPLVAFILLAVLRQVLYRIL